MSGSIKIKSSLKDYQISISQNDVVYDLSLESETFFLIDSVVASLYYPDKTSKIFTLDAVESNKNFESVVAVIEWLKLEGASRKSRLVVVGGGVIQDLGTMVASVYMRGIDWVLVPTTLLSMVDSCIGGKSSLNVGPFKNIAGNFYPPSQILIFPSYCRTLSNKQFLEGLCEAIKISYASDPAVSLDEFSLLIANKNFDQKNIYDVVFNSLSLKKKIIEEDEFDTGRRLLLNFGHTFGHAIESASKYAIPHGIAVGIGMMMAIDFSRDNHSDLNSDALYALLKQMLELEGTVTVDLEVLEAYALMEAFKADKKHENHSYVIITPTGPRGSLELQKLAKANHAEAKLMGAFQAVGTMLSSYEI